VQKSYQAYIQNQVMTAPKEKLVLMLYDGMVRFIKNAMVACGEGNIEATNNNLLKAQSILFELMGSLDHEAGEIAENLLLIYDYMQRRLVEANIKKDVSMMEEVKGMAVELREAWQQSIKNLKNQSYSEGAGSPG